MVAAIYARKSTDQPGVSEEQRSVSRQIDRGRSYATRRGWTVQDAHVFVDDGISGAEFANRPAFLRLMNAAAAKPRPPFQFLIMSEESRLGRESIETAYALKQLIQSGVRVFFYLEDRERTLDTPTDKLMLSVTAFADELEREKARQRTADAMRRKAEAGHVTGGRVFGYRNVDVTETGSDGRPRRLYVTREIDPAEAAVVRQIFAWCASGLGLKGIAKRLNDQGAPAPLAQQGRPRGWAPSSVREVLYRELYRGTVIYGATKKRDAWGRRKPQDRPESEQIRHVVPDLRIIDEAQWTETHAQATARRAVYSAKDGSPAWQRPPTGGTTKYLLSGLSRCGACGGGFIVRSREHGAQRSYRYGCYCNWTRGQSVCANRHEVLRDIADAALTEHLAMEVLQPRLIEEMLDEALEEVSAAAGQRADRRDLLRARLATLDRQINNLVATAAAGGNVPLLVDRLQALQQEREKIARDYAALEATSVVRVPTFSRPALRQRISDWQGLITTRPAETRRLLETVLADRLVFTPIPAPSGVQYEVVIRLQLDRVIREILPIGLASPGGSATYWRKDSRLILKVA